MSKSPTPESPTVFLGDSLTAYHDWRGRFGEVVNLAIPGDTVGALLWRTDAVKNYNPGQTVLMIGINDLLQGQPLEMIKEEYATVLEELQGCGKLFVISVLPVIAEAQTEAINEEVIALNHWIRAQRQNTPFIYIDLYSKVVDASSLGIKASYTVDGVHLSESAYRVWEEKLSHYL